MELLCICNCMNELMDQGIIVPYCPPYNVLKDGYEAKEGTLCIAKQIVEDNGYYDDYNWVSNISVYNELIPVKYCPVCGKKVEYLYSDTLTKKL